MKYPFSVFQSEAEGHRFWVAKSSLLKGCVGQGDSQQEAIDELAENEEAWLEVAQAEGIAVPDIPTEEIAEYSGRMTLRIAPNVHRKASQYAKREGISLNQYINDAIVGLNAELSRMS